MGRGKRPFTEFDGVKYYKTAQGYWLGGNRSNCKRLHIAVWEKYNGKIPDGYHIHHIDGNKDNNDISNLELMKASDHISMHSRSAENVSRARETIRRAAEAAKVWHGSDAGREWHREHALKVAQEQAEKKVTLVCQVCGREFTTLKQCASRTKFCGNNCKATALRRRRKNEGAICC